MTSLMFMLMLQYVVSTKAGMVNHVQGKASVKPTESVAAGVPIVTGPDGYAEILLNPGSFLRLGENSQGLFEDVDLAHIVVRAISGAAIIEVTEIDEEFPITVVSGELTVQIVQSGLYRFEDGRASIISGKLQTADSKIAYKKGWSISSPAGGIRAVKIAQNTPTALDVWSKARSSVIAAANGEMVKTCDDKRFPVQTRSAWIFVPQIGVWTFVPLGRRDSPYGFRYRFYLQDLLRQTSPQTQTAPRVSQDEIVNRKDPEIPVGNAP